MNPENLVLHNRGRRVHSIVKFEQAHTDVGNSILGHHCLLSCQHQDHDGHVMVHMGMGNYMCQKCEYPTNGWMCPLSKVPKGYLRALQECIWRHKITPDQNACEECVAKHFEDIMTNLETEGIPDDMDALRARLNG